MVRLGFKVRPLRDGGGKPSPGRSPPPLTKPSANGFQDQLVASTLICLPISVNDDDPLPPDLLAQVRSLVPGSHAPEPLEGQPLFLDHLRRDWPVTQIQSTIGGGGTTTP